MARPACPVRVASRCHRSGALRHSVHRAVRRHGRLRGLSLAVSGARLRAHGRAGQGGLQIGCFAEGGASLIRGYWKTLYGPPMDLMIQCCGVNCQ